MDSLEHIPYTFWHQNALFITKQSFGYRIIGTWGKKFSTARFPSSMTSLGNTCYFFPGFVLKTLCIQTRLSHHPCLSTGLNKHQNSSYASFCRSTPIKRWKAELQTDQGITHTSHRRVKKKQTKTQVSVPSLLQHGSAMKQGNQIERKQKSRCHLL